MFAQDVMTGRVYLISGHARVTEAARSMRDHGVGILPVVEGSRVVGMISDRDIVTRVVARQLHADETRVTEVMTPEIYSCAPGDTVGQVAAIMERHGVRRVLVIGPQGMPVGIISIDDLATRSLDKVLPSEALHRLTANLVPV